MKSVVSGAIATLMLLGMLAAAAMPKQIEQQPAGSGRRRQSDADVRSRPCAPPIPPRYLVGKSRRIKSLAAESRRRYAPIPPLCHSGMFTTSCGFCRCRYLCVLSPPWCGERYTQRCRSSLRLCCSSWWNCCGRLLLSSVLRPLLLCLLDHGGAGDGHRLRRDLRGVRRSSSAPSTACVNWARSCFAGPRWCSSFSRFSWRAVARPLPDSASPPPL